MKGNLIYSLKIAIFLSLHYVIEAPEFLIEKYLSFSKMDKKNVQKSLAENVLTDKKIRLP